MKVNNYFCFGGGGGEIEKLEKRKFSNGKILMWTDNTKFVAICDLSISIGF